MLIRCHKESQHPAEWALGLRLNIRRTRKTQHDGHNSGVKIWSLCSVSSTLSHANLEQPFRTLAIKWEMNIFLKKSSCVFLPASLSCVVYSCVCLWYWVVVMLNDDVDNYLTQPQMPGLHIYLTHRCDPNKYYNSDVVSYLEHHFFGVGGLTFYLWYRKATKNLVWIGLVLRHISNCRLFNAKSIFIHINSSI